MLRRWNIVRNKGYQSVDNVSSAITTKVKGVGYVYNKANNQSVRTVVNNRFTFGDQYRYFDVGDYIIPPIQDSSVSTKQALRRFLLKIGYFYLFKYFIDICHD